MTPRPQPAATGSAGAAPGLPSAARRALTGGQSLTFKAEGRTIIDGVNISVSAGEIVTLIGPNGAGKTTLARLLLGLLTPTSGHVWRRPGLRVGYVPQRFAVDPTIPLTVRRFLTLGRRAGREAIDAVLREVGAPDLGDAQTSSLSGGEFQRVSMARALIGDPELLVLDEPVQAVDYVGEAQLYELIGLIAARRSCGVLLISHDLHVVMGRSDRVVCLNRHVCCEGAPERVSSDPEYERLFGPGAARAVATYRHHHDHDHDLSGNVAPHQRDGAEPPS